MSQETKVLQTHSAAVPEALQQKGNKPENTTELPSHHVATNATQADLALAEDNNQNNHISEVSTCSNQPSTQEPAAAEEAELTLHPVVLSASNREIDIETPLAGKNNARLPILQLLGPSGCVAIFGGSLVTLMVVEFLICSGQVKGRSAASKPQASGVGLC